MGRVPCDTPQDLNRVHSQLRSMEEWLRLQALQQLTTFVVVFFGGDEIFFTQGFQFRELLFQGRAGCNRYGHWLWLDEAHRQARGRPPEN